MTHLAEKKTAKTTLLGVTEEDLCDDNARFLSGLHDRDHDTALISLARLNPSLLKQGHGRVFFLRRVLQEAVHRLGHLNGLGHCDAKRCVMHFRQGLGEAEQIDSHFCRGCRECLT